VPLPRRGMKRRRKGRKKMGKVQVGEGGTKMVWIP
jgi:hypothetical protein